MKSFRFKSRDMFSGVHLLGTLLILAGIFALATPHIFTLEVSMTRVLAIGFGAVVLGFFIVQSYSGTIIDFSQKCFKEYQSIGGIKKGQWKELPQIETIDIQSKTYHTRNTPNGISPTLSGKTRVYKVRLLNEKQESVLSFSYTKKNRAESDAKKLAEGLDVQLLD